MVSGAAIGSAIAPRRANGDFGTSSGGNRAPSGAKDLQPRNLTHEELEKNYGCDPSDMAKVTDFAHQHGLVVVESSPAKRLVRLSGTVKAFEKAFDVSLGHYEHANFTYRGRTGSIGIPKDLDGIITAVLGLDNRPFARPHFIKRKPHPTRNGHPAASGCELLGVFAGDCRRTVQLSPR